MQMIETRKPTQSFRDWMERQYGTAFEITCEGLLECGGVGGFSGMMTHVETTELYEEFEEEIWEALSEDAERLGLSHPLELIAGLNGAKIVWGSPQLWDLLVWYMAERVAQEIADRKDKDSKMAEAIAERLTSLGSFLFPEGFEYPDSTEDDEDGLYLEIRLQLVDGDWTVWSGDNQYDTDHRGAWGLGGIRPEMTEADYQMTAKAMLLEARAAEEEQTDVEDVAS